MYINFNGRLEHPKNLFFCCEPIDNRPAVSFSDDAATTLRDFIDARLRLINEGHSDETEYSQGCRKCVHYQKKEWSVSHQINYVNLSMYPSPCQCKCFYCNVHNESQAITDPQVKERYEQIFDILEYAKKCEIISPNAIWQISCGEITIHPYKERIFDLIKGQRAVFYTNCFIYDEKIAENLRTNQDSSINLSIDAGTPKTWHKVKGIDNFEDVMMNLTHYYVDGSHPGQITLKYIIFPDTNDSEDDYLCLMEYMKILKVKHLSISRDTRIKYNQTSEENQKLLDSAARLVYRCTINEISVDMFSYSKKEQDEIIELVKKLANNNKNK